MTRWHVWSVPMGTRFRGITVREGMLLRGDAGWGEFSPFLEYDASVAAPWLRAAREAADEGWPAPLRDSVPVNVTVPAVDPQRAAEIVRSSQGCRTAKVKVAEPGQSRADEEARLEAVRDVLGPDGRIRVDANGGWDVDTARDWVSAVQPRSWAPRELRRVDAIPLLHNGKVDRRALQQAVP